MWEFIWRSGQCRCSQVISSFFYNICVKETDFLLCIAQFVFLLNTVYHIIDVFMSCISGRPLHPFVLCHKNTDRQLDTQKLDCLNAGLDNKTDQKHDYMIFFQQCRKLNGVTVIRIIQILHDMICGTLAFLDTGRIISHVSAIQHQMV